MDDQKLLTLKEAAAALPKIGGRKVSYTCLWRWASKGIRGVRLPCRRFGRVWVTTRGEVDTFTRALAALPAVEYAPRTDRKPTPKARARAVARAEAALDKRGI